MSFNGEVTSYRPPPDTIKLKMDAYHDMVAEIGALKKENENLKLELQHANDSFKQLRDYNKVLLDDQMKNTRAIAALRTELREARSAPRMFKTVKVA